MATVLYVKIHVLVARVRDLYVKIRIKWQVTRLGPGLFLTASGMRLKRSGNQFIHKSMCFGRLGA